MLQAHPQPNPTSPTRVVFVFVFARLAGFDFNVAFFLGLAFAWVLPWLWFLLLDLVHLRHFPNQVAARFVFKSLPGFPLPLFLLAQLLLHLLPQVQLPNLVQLHFSAGDFRVEAGFFIHVILVQLLGLRRLAKRVQLKACEHLETFVVRYCTCNIYVYLTIMCALTFAFARPGHEYDYVPFRTREIQTNSKTNHVQTTISTKVDKSQRTAPQT